MVIMARSPPQAASLATRFSTSPLGSTSPPYDMPWVKGLVDFDNPAGLRRCGSSSNLCPAGAFSIPPFWTSHATLQRFDPRPMIPTSPPSPAH